MTHTPFTGKNMTFTFDSVKLEKVKKVDLTETGGPDAEQMETTAAPDTERQFIADPLGSKGRPTASIAVSTWASLHSYGDGKGSAIALNDPATAVFDQALGTANANTYTHSALELTARTTEGAWDEFATQDLTFEANGLGAWTAPV